MTDTDAGHWLTYREAAEMLGLKVEGVRSLARRKGWLRRLPNEIGGVSRVLVPVGLQRRDTAGSNGAMNGAVNGAERDCTDGANDHTDGSTAGIPSGDSRDDAHENDPVAVIDPAVAPSVLAVEVAMLRERLTDKDAVITDLHLTVADLRQRLDGAERRLDEALAAQRRATDELKGLQSAVDRQRTMGLSRRLRWALRGR